jgi:hypothetical protein
MTAFIFDLNERLTEGNLVALDVILPNGHSLTLWAEVALEGRIAVLRQFAIYSHEERPNMPGMTTLFRLAQAVMEEFDVDLIRIEEARRTSGANPNRTVQTIDLKRR